MKLSRQVVQNVKRRWFDLWDARLADGGDAHAEMWITAVTDELKYQGYDIVPNDVFASEDDLGAEGLEQDYIDALITITKASPESAMALVTATGEQRQRAVTIVRAYQKATSQKGDY